MQHTTKWLNSQWWYRAPHLAIIECLSSNDSVVTSLGRHRSSFQDGTMTFMDLNILLFWWLFILSMWGSMGIIVSRSMILLNYHQLSEWNINYIYLYVYVICICIGLFIPSVIALAFFQVSSRGQRDESFGAHAQRAVRWSYNLD